MTATPDRSVTEPGLGEASGAAPPGWANLEGPRPPIRARPGAASLERTLAALSRDTPLALLRTDAYGTILAVNPAAARLLGVDPRFMVGKPLPAYVPLSARRAFRAAIASASRSEGRARWTQPLQARDGRVFEASLAVSVTHPPEEPGPVLHWLLRDRSASPAAETVEEVDSDQREHQRRLGLLGMMTAMAMHDLRQPIGALGIYLDSLENSGCGSLTPESLDEVIGKMQGQVARASALLENMCDLVRRASPDRRATDLGQVLRAAVEHCVPYGGGAGRVELATPEDLPPVWGNAVELEQVFVNLIMNALRAVAQVPARRRRVLLEAHACRGVVEVVVHDQGPGMDGAQRSMSGGFTTSSSDGLGVGLAICRQIVETHGGRVSAPEVPGFGCEVRVTLPVVRGDTE